jgi:hypothetical protein
MDVEGSRGNSIDALTPHLTGGTGKNHVNGRQMAGPSPMFEAVRL